MSIDYIIPFTVDDKILKKYNKNIMINIVDNPYI